MIHFTCDACQRPIQSEEETRFVVRVEIFAALEDEAECDLDDSDHLQDIEDLLEQMDDLQDAMGESDERLYKQVRYDLCEKCRTRFLRNPFGQPARKQLGFSSN